MGAPSQVPGSPSPGVPALEGQGAGIRVLALNGKEFFELRYRTLTVQQGVEKIEEDIAILKNKGVLRTGDFTGVEGKRELLYAGLRLPVEGKKENGHVNVTILLPKEAVEAIVRLENFPRYVFAVYGHVLYGGGKVINRIEHEATVSGKKKHIKRYEVHRYIDEGRGIDVVLHKDFVDEYDAFIVKGRKSNDRVELYDAYEAKEMLKYYGFQWDPNKKCWYGKPESLERIGPYVEVIWK